MANQTIEEGTTEIEVEEPSHGNIALMVIAGAQLMVVLDATIVNIALVRIHHANLGFSTTSLSWVINAYTLTFGGLLLLGGRAGDLFGRRRMFMFGVLLFAAASLAGGFAQDEGFLLAMRALQGVGGAIASPTALSLITTNFPEGPERNRAFGIYAAVSGAGAALGLLLGGILVDTLSWRYVFFVNLPIGLAIAAAAPFVIKDSERIKHNSLDLAGAITSTAGMASLVYGFIRAATPADGWGNSVTIGSFVVAVVLLAAFAYIESTVAEPLMPLRLFSSRVRVGSYIVMLAVGAAVFAMFFFLTQYIQQVMGFSPLKAGLAFLPVSFVIIIVAQICSRLVAKFPIALIISFGCVSNGAGLVLLSRLTVNSSYLTGILPAIALIAVGMGFIFVPITLTAVAGVGAHDTGIASAMLNVCQQLGGTLGLSALITVFSHSAASWATAHHTLSKPAIAAGSFTHGATAAFGVGALFALGGLIAAIVLVRIRASDLPDSPASMAA